MGIVAPVFDSAAVFDLEAVEFALVDQPMLRSAALLVDKPIAHLLATARAKFLVFLHGLPHPVGSLLMGYTYQ
jgi:hypothetical protein